MSTKLMNPGVPFLYTVPTGHVQVGQKFVVEGEPSHGANRFCINFIYNATQQCVFHLDFRFDQGETVRNTNFPHGQWGHEERSPLPLHRGHRFKLELKVHYDRFTIEINGQHYCEFRHRAPNTVADTLQIQGDVHITMVKFK